MRIRKGRQTRGNIRASLAMASPSDMDDISQQLELVSSSRGLKQKIHESEAMNLNVAERSFEKAPLELLERLQITSNSVLIPPNRPYMNLDEFVTSLARTNCFPADDDSDDPHSDEDHSDDQHNNYIGQSFCSLTNSSVQARDDEESPDFGRMFGAVSPGSAEELRGDIAVVETSLRLATPSSMSANPHYKSANPRTTTSEMEARAAAANQADQAMKSSTENVDQRSGRHTRVSSSPGSNGNRNCIPSPASFYPTDPNDTQEEASSDFSIQMAESSRKPPSKQRTPRTPVSFSSSTLKTPSNDNTSEERKQKLGKPIAKRMMKRSGRPKKLKYLQQDNVEELGNQCNRRDGKGWTCPLLAKPGYQLCDHHLDKLRCKPGSRAKYNKSKKKKKNNNGES